jgi:hypothetical protein
MTVRAGRLRALSRPLLAFGRLREFVMDFRPRAEAEVAAGVPLTYRFADVLLRTNRADLKMPIGEVAVQDALSACLGEDRGVIGYLAKELLGGDPELYELSCLISDPGSQRQTVHPDTPYGGQGGRDGDAPVLFTFFIALQVARPGPPPSPRTPRPAAVVPDPHRT